MAAATIDRRLWRHAPARTTLPRTIRSGSKGESEARAAEPAQTGNGDVQSGPEQKQERHARVARPDGTRHRQNRRQDEHRIGAQMDDELPDGGRRLASRDDVNLQLDVRR